MVVIVKKIDFVYIFRLGKGWCEINYDMFCLVEYWFVLFEMRWIEIDNYDKVILEGRYGELGLYFI